MSVAAAPTAITALGSATARSIGDVKMEIQEMPLISGDVSATVTGKGLSRIDYCIVIGASLTSYPVITGNSAALAFVDPVATVKAQIILLGR